MKYLNQTLQQVGTNSQGLTVKFGASKRPMMNDDQTNINAMNSRNL